MKLDLSEADIQELQLEREKRLAEVQHLDKVSFDKRQRELFQKLWHNIHRIDAEISHRKEQKE